MHVNEELLFNLALAIDNPTDREEFLDRRCQNDVALRSRLLKLLQSYETADYMESTHDQVSSLLQEAKQEGLLNSQLGPFIIRELLGEGGMGQVYLGERLDGISPKTVAIKLLKPWLNSREILARFQLEQWALEQMDHPNIAKFVSSGSSDFGKPYFAMEWVNGMPITEYCNRFHLSIPERLQLFLSLAQAVSHAHDKGIVHRDLKPSNILVERHQSQSKVKIIDFGIAKACMSEFQCELPRTRYQQWLGTANYMSPEQKQWSADVDLRSDVYSLGVILFELLTGQLPSISIEAGEPSLNHGPSQSKEGLRLVDAHQSLTQEALLNVCRERNTDLLTLQGILKGDLQWIAAKALAYSRGERYEDAGALASDIQAVLEHRKPIAGPPSLFVRCARWHRRNALYAYASMAVVSSVALAVGFMVYQRSNQLAVERLKSLESALQVSDTDRLHRKFISDVKMAADLLAAGHRSQASGLIKPWTEEDSRFRDHFAINFLNAHCSPLHSEWSAHSADVLNFDISKDGQHMISCDLAGDIAIWDRATHQVLRRLHPCDGEVTNARFSPDGLWIASVGTDRLLRLWSADGDEELGALSGHERTIHGLAWSPDGKRIATADRDGVVNIWDFASKRLERVLSRQSGPIRALAWSPDGRWIAAGDDSRGARLFETNGWTQVAFVESSDHVPLAIAFSADSKTLVFGGYRGGLTIFDTERLTLLQVLKTDYQIGSLAFVDDQQLLVGSLDGRIQIFFRVDDHWNGARIVNLDVNTWVRSIVPIVGSNQVYVATQKDRLIRSFDTEAFATFRHSDWNGQQLRPANESGMTLEFESGGLNPRIRGETVEDHSFNINGRINLGCLPQYYRVGKLVILGTARMHQENELEFIDAYHSTGQIVWSHQFPKNLCSIEISRDSKNLAATGSNGRVTILDLGSQQTRELTDENESFVHNSIGLFTPESDAFLVGHAGTNRLKRYRAGSWEVQGEVQTETPIHALTLSPSGDVLFVGEEDGISAWTPDLEHRLWQFYFAGSNLSSAVYAIAVSKEESILAAYCSDGCIRVVDIAARTETLTIPLPKLAVVRIEFTDSQTLKLYTVPSTCYEFRAK